MRHYPQTSADDMFTNKPSGGLICKVPIIYKCSKKNNLNIENIITHQLVVDCCCWDCDCDCDCDCGCDCGWMLLWLWMLWMLWF